MSQVMSLRGDRMETTLLLSIVNTKLRNGQMLEDIAVDVELTVETLVDHLAIEGYVFDTTSNQFKR